MKIHVVLFLLLVACGGEMSCTRTQVLPPAAGNVSQTLASRLEGNYIFSLFTYALKKTGLNSLASGSTPYTFLVPDNDAFARDSIFGDSDIDKLDTAYLRQWISYHILPGNVTVASVGQSINNLYKSITGQPLYFSRPVPGPNQGQANANEVLHINGDTVNTPDITAANGVIQILNRPLKLPVTSVQAWLAANPRYSYFVTALKHFGLWDELTGPGPFTIFAQDNHSFTQFGISADSVNRMDTVQYYTLLFGYNVLSAARIFLTDFVDVGQGTSCSVQQTYFTPNGAYYLQGTGTCGLSAELSDPGGYYITFPDGSTGPVPPTTWVDPDIIALNGVVQGIDGLLLAPGQELKKN